MPTDNYKYLYCFKAILNINLNPIFFIYGKEKR